MADMMKTANQSAMIIDNWIAFAMKKHGDGLQEPD